MSLHLQFWILDINMWLAYQWLWWYWLHQSWQQQPCTHCLQITSKALMTRTKMNIKIRWSGLELVIWRKKNLLNETLISINPNSFGRLSDLFGLPPAFACSHSKMWWKEFDFQSSRGAPDLHTGDLEAWAHSQCHGRSMYLWGGDSRQDSYGQVLIHGLLHWQTLYVNNWARR